MDFDGGLCFFPTCHVPTVTEDRGLSWHGLHGPCQLASGTPFRASLSLFPAGPISQKMYAMLPCGGIGVSGVWEWASGSPSLAPSSLPPRGCSPALWCPLPFLPSPCRGHTEARSPAPAGGQRHCVERDALLQCCANGGGLPGRAGLQGGCRRAQGKVILWPLCFWLRPVSLGAGVQGQQ